MSLDDVLKKMDTMIELRNLSNKTKLDYLRKTKQLYTWCQGKGIVFEDLSYENLHEFILEIKHNLNYAPKTINSIISVIQFIFIYVLSRPFDKYMVPKAKVTPTVHEIISVNEVVKFINSLDFIKHKAMFTLLYSCGLRGSELCCLRYSDVSRERMTLFVEKSKNRTSRYVPLTKAALDILTEYWKTCGRPTGWLFPGSNPGSHITRATLRSILVSNLNKLGWNDRRITTHSFRHFMGTHLYESGTDLLVIQKFMGHKCLTSTLTYITLCGNKSVSNPFENAWESANE